MKFFISGVAGFIGFHLTRSLLEMGHEVVGVDNLNDYYDPRLKKSRLAHIHGSFEERFNFKLCSLENRKELDLIFEQNEFDTVINLAAQAGVRYSLENPNAYLDSNLIGFMNILEVVKDSKIKHFIFASSSSVYGMNEKRPFSTSDNTDYPISLYAATKKSNEMLAFSYSHLFNIATTGLRFFTVYGPFGRPDMAYYKFTKSILEEEEIEVFNNGIMERDFTYVDDIVDGIIKVIKNIPKSLQSKITKSDAPYKIYNIGNNNPISLMEFIKTIETCCKKKAILKFLPMQPGDVPSTFADIEDTRKEISYQPSIDIQTGIGKFVEWYKSYHKIK